MWYLSSEVDSRIIYIIKQNSDLIIGRSVDDPVCDFAIHDDASISRKHASLSVSNKTLYVQDLGSRYGTFVNNSKLETNSKVSLDIDNVIKFGKMNSLWKVHKINLITCTSTLKGENLACLRQCLEKLGATLKNDWDESCVYLTMPAITLTIKVVLALVHGAHIVNTMFWSKCLEAVETNKILPDPRKYTPEIIESTLNKENISFLPDNKRQLLFQGKKFIFFSKRQLEMYKQILNKSAASPILLSGSNMTKSMLAAPDIIVIQFNLTNTSQESENQKNQINDIVAYLTSKGKRLVAEAEIGLAILYCSTEKYCNPDFNFPSEIIKQPITSNKSTTVLAGESQELSNKVQAVQVNIVVDETLLSKSINNTENLSNDVGLKRKHDDNGQEINAPKKLATQKTDVENDLKSNPKRKHMPENDGTQENPSKKVAVDNDEDGFNFVETNNSSKQNTVDKKLNLSKPIKRKYDNVQKDDDDLFDFVQDEKPALKKQEVSVSSNTNKKMCHQISSEVNTVDIASMRGIKLKELNENNLNWNLNVKVKKEADELDEQMNKLDLGSTTIKIRSDLVIKKEPVHVEIQDNQVKNFKKFKKVWPLKMNVTTRSSTNDITPKSSELSEGSSMTY